MAPGRRSYKVKGKFKMPLCEKSPELSSLVELIQSSSTYRVSIQVCASMLKRKDLCQIACKEAQGVQSDSLALLWGSLTLALLVVLDNFSRHFRNAKTVGLNFNCIRCFCRGATSRVLSFQSRSAMSRSNCSKLTST